MRFTTWTLAATLAASLGLTACEGDKPSSTAPSATTLKDTKPKAAGAMTFAVDTSSAKVEFMMDAPNEKIRGRVPGATKGNLQIDLLSLIHI